MDVPVTLAWWTCAIVEPSEKLKKLDDQATLYIIVGYGYIRGSRWWLSPSCGVQYTSPNAAQHSGSGHNRRPNEDTSQSRPPKAKCTEAESGIQAAAADENTRCEEAQTGLDSPPSTVSLPKHQPRLSPPPWRARKIIF